MSDNRSCFCQVLSRLIKCCQIIGIFPLNLRVRKPNSENNNRPVSCICGNDGGYEYKEKFFSLPSLLNIIAFFVYLFYMFWIHIYIFKALQQFFDGVELYALNIQVKSLYCKVVILIFFSRWKNHEFTKGWRVLMEVHRNLQARDEAPPPDLEKLKTYANITLFVILMGTVGYQVFFSWILVRPCLGGKMLLPCGLFSVAFGQKMAHLVIVLYYQLFCALFLNMCLTIRGLHIHIVEKIKLVLNMEDEFKVLQRAAGASASTSARCKDLESLRLSHEKLCIATEYFGRYFGIPAVTIVLSSFISITCGIYSVTLGTLKEAGKNGIPTLYYMIWVFHSYFGLLTLIITLVSGQLVKIAGTKARGAIYGARFSNFTADLKFEVGIFSQKLMNTPCITAWGIADIGMGLFAAALANITTYILVLLQFSFSVFKPADPTYNSTC